MAADGAANVLAELLAGNAQAGLLALGSASGTPGTKASGRWCETMCNRIFDALPQQITLARMLAGCWVEGLATRAALVARAGQAGPKIDWATHTEPRLQNAGGNVQAPAPAAPAQAPGQPEPGGPAQGPGERDDDGDEERESRVSRSPSAPSGRPRNSRAWLENQSPTTREHVRRLLQESRREEYDDEDDEDNGESRARVLEGRAGGERASSPSAASGRGLNERQMEMMAREIARDYKTAFPTERLRACTAMRVLELLEGAELKYDILCDDLTGYEPKIADGFDIFVNAYKRFVRLFITTQRRYQICVDVPLSRVEAYARTASSALTAAWNTLGPAFQASLDWKATSEGAARRLLLHMQNLWEMNLYNSSKPETEDLQVKVVAERERKLVQEDKKRVRSAEVAKTGAGGGAAGSGGSTPASSAARSAASAKKRQRTYGPDECRYGEKGNCKRLQKGGSCSFKHDDD